MEPTQAGAPGRSSDTPAAGCAYGPADAPADRYVCGPADGCAGRTAGAPPRGEIGPLPPRRRRPGQPSRTTTNPSASTAIGGVGSPGNPEAVTTPNGPSRCTPRAGGRPTDDEASIAVRTERRTGASSRRSSPQTVIPALPRSAVPGRPPGPAHSRPFLSMTVIDRPAAGGPPWPRPRCIQRGK